jgi:hypothetical protein
MEIIQSGNKKMDEIFKHNGTANSRKQPFKE